MGKSVKGNKTWGKLIWISRNGSLIVSAARWKCNVIRSVFVQYKSVAETKGWVSRSTRIWGMDYKQFHAGALISMCIEWYLAYFQIILVNQIETISSKKI